MNDTKRDPLRIAGVELESRLILGTGKFSSRESLQRAIERSEISMITVALRRVDIANPDDTIISAIDTKKYIILPNTSGAQNAEEAVRLARIARASGISDWIKLEVTPDPKYLLPDGEETLKAALILVREGFKVMPYINADPILARKLENAGAVSVMPLGSPIGTNRGLKTIDQIRIIIEQSNVPVIVDAGLGKPSDAAMAMEIGADAVLVNTAIATAGDPAMMAEAFKNAVIAGRMAYRAGLTKESDAASASGTLEWISRL
ncbi:MAG: thiazole synthase [Spirochaetes bacterium RBG_16_49_21]|nr:MAG: thiazole synthase [Spirochaetes bacterium RBG_16_49_21]